VYYSIQAFWLQLYPLLYLKKAEFPGESVGGRTTLWANRGTNRAGGGMDARFAQKSTFAGIAPIGPLMTP